MVVHVAVGNDILNMAVIAAERAAPRVAGRNAGQERSEVLGGGAFAYKDVAAPAKVLAHLLKRGALVGIRNAGDEIGVEIPAKPGACPSTILPWDVPSWIFASTS